MNGGLTGLERHQGDIIFGWTNPFKHRSRSGVGWHVLCLFSVGSDSDESFSDSQEDEDQQIWEEQQIKKGVKQHQVRPSTVTMKA